MFLYIRGFLFSGLTALLLFFPTNYAKASTCLPSYACYIPPNPLLILEWGEHDCPLGGTCWFDIYEWSCNSTICTPQTIGTTENECLLDWTILGQPWYPLPIRGTVKCYPRIATNLNVGSKQVHVQWQSPQTIDGQCPISQCFINCQSDDWPECGMRPKRCPD